MTQVLFSGKAFGLPEADFQVSRCKKCRLSGRAPICCVALHPRKSDQEVLREITLIRKADAKVHGRRDASGPIQHKGSPLKKLREVPQARTDPSVKEHSSADVEEKQSGQDESKVDGNLGLRASLGVFGGLVLMVGAGYVCQDAINSFLNFFIALVEEFGPLGYIAYGVVYGLLELAAVPAIPLTMTAGVIFGVVPGVALVSVSGTAAATAAFLIARYAARDKVLAYAKEHPKFAAIDAAVGQDSFRVVTLLRLSPLLPLALSNYLYGLTSVGLLPYVLGSWLGMLPGTCAYVAAGAYGHILFGATGTEALPLAPWQVGAGVGASLLAVAYVGRLAREALAEAAEQ